MEDKKRRSRDEFHHFPDPRPCPVCGEKFVPAIFHTYKIFKNPYYVKVCSYKCAREWEKKGGIARGC
jgi:hypothetical protein